MTVCTLNPSDISLLALALSGGSLTLTSAATTSVVVGIAVDFTHSKVWGYNQLTGRWNSDVIANQNPTTNTGGISFTVTGPIFPGMSFFGSTTDTITANFGATSFLYMPSGFSAWGSSTTWNPADKSASISLSGGNLIASNVSHSNWVSARATTSASAGLLYFELTCVCASNQSAIGLANSTQVLTSFIGSSSATGGSWQSDGSNLGAFNVTVGNYEKGGLNTNWRGARGTVSRSTGKYVFECTATTNTGTGSDGIIIGVANASAPLDYASGSNVGYPGAAVGGVGFQYGFSASYYNGAGGTFGSGAPALVTTMVAIDFGNDKAWIWNPTTSKWNNDVIGNQNPATNTGGQSITALVGSGPLFPMLSFFYWPAGNNAATVNFGATSFSNSIPSGFVSWNTDPPIALSSNAAIQIMQRIGPSYDDDQLAQEWSPSQRLRNYRAQPATVNVPLTGVSATAGIGGITPIVAPSLTGAAASAGIGSLVFTANSNVSLTGVAATAGVGSITPNGRVSLTGVQATAGIGSIATEVDTSVALTGVAASASVGTMIPNVGAKLSGIAATAHVGTITITPTSTASLFGVQATTGIGQILPLVTPTATNVNVTGVSATAGIGLLAIETGPQLVGVQATAGIGTIQALAYRAGLSMTGLVCQSIPQDTTDLSVALRWSDTKGQTFGDSAVKTVGMTGAYLTSIQWRRLAMGRDRIFELSWSSPAPTALAGASIQYEIAKT